jgi:hypothetical protein
VADAEAFEGDVVGETPNLDGTREVVRRFDCLAVTRETSGRIDAMSRWAGESVGAVTRAWLRQLVCNEYVLARTKLIEMITCDFHVLVVR